MTPLAAYVARARGLMLRELELLPLSRRNARPQEHREIRLTRSATGSGERLTPDGLDIARAGGDGRENARFRHVVALTDPLVRSCGVLRRRGPRGRSVHTEDESGQRTG